jgi:hypothetical protein
MPTDYDRLKAAKIVAYALYRGESLAVAERRLREIIPGATESDVQRGLSEGQIAYSLQRAANVGAQGVWNTLQQSQEQLGATGYDVLVRFRIGPNDETDWRSATLTLNPGESVYDAFLAAGNTIEEKFRDSLSGGGSPDSVIESVDFVYVAPMFEG